ncbi:MAG: hypothetical protein AAF804_12895 [Bacteroidota bacterium]
MKAHLALFLCLLALMVSGCSILGIDLGPEPELPPITAEGADTFGCLVDGRVFFAGPSGFYRPTLWVFYDSTEDVLTIWANYFRFSMSLDEEIELIVNKPEVGDTLWLGGQGDSVLSEPPLRYASYTEFQNGNQLVTWQEDSLTYSGYVTFSNLRLESGADPKFAAGTFAFNAQDSSANFSIEITEGRFDVSVQ